LITSAASARRRGRPKSEEKRCSIRESAARLFLDGGFERTSMDAVARRAGVSKQTVYGHFENKERLFRSVIAHRVAEYFPEDPLRYGAHHGVVETLSMIGRQYMRLILSPDAINVFRLLAANAGRHPKMVELYYEEGPGRLNGAIRAYLDQARADGALSFTSAESAAARFCTLLRGDAFFRATLGLLEKPSADKLEAHVADCVEVFLRVYGKR